jgi:hypothetical protein
MGVIVATSIDVVARDVAIRLALMEGGCFDTDADRARIERYPDLHEHGGAQERRVAALFRALALVHGALLPKGSMDDWGGLTGLQ